ncbi:MAG: alpha/beta hydrolase [Clostridia bacterium]|nr:alpha/beta hydrolase [Clostridia bacterium]
MKAPARLVSFIVSLIFIISPFTVNAAGNDINPYPVIFVNGLNTSDIINSQTGETVFPFSSEKIKSAVKAVLVPALAAMLTGNYRILADPIVNLAEILFGDMTLDENGDPLYPTTYDPADMIDLEQDFTRYYIPGIGYSPENEISFTYDWRLSPVDIAEDLNDLIEAVCASTGAEKVKLIGFSMGTCVINSYISLYGYERADSVLYIAGAYNGLNSAGEPFSDRLDFSGRSIVNYMPAVFGDDLTGRTFTALFDVLYDSGVADRICSIAKNIVEVNKEYVYEKALAKLFCRYGSLWSFVPYEMYDNAKAFVLDDAEVSPAFEAKIDYYHYEVQGKNEERINYFLSHGIKFGIIAKYGFTTPPVVESLDENGDGVIETKYESFGAVCADAGETLGDRYVQQVNDGHNHLSPDNIIDASTAKFPEYTWFIKNCYHDSNGCLDGLKSYILMSDEQVSVFESEIYPQFMIKTSDDKAVPLTKENDYSNHTAQSRTLIKKIRVFICFIDLSAQMIKEKINQP